MPIIQQRSLLRSDLLIATIMRNMKYVLFNLPHYKNQSIYRCLSETPDCFEEFFRPDIMFFISSYINQIVSMWILLKSEMLVLKVIHNWIVIQLDVGWCRLALLHSSTRLNLVIKTLLFWNGYLILKNMTSYLIGMVKCYISSISTQRKVERWRNLRMKHYCFWLTALLQQ